MLVTIICPFFTAFLTCLVNFSPFSSYAKLWLVYYFSLEEHKICNLKGVNFSTQPESICKQQIKGILPNVYLVYCMVFRTTLAPFSTVIQLNHGSQCTHPCFPGVLLTSTLLNSLPNKILDQSKFKGLADDKINASKKLKFILGIVETFLGKGENAGYQHFLLFPKCFQKPPSSGSLKVRTVW